MRSKFSDQIKQKLKEITNKELLIYLLNKELPNSIVSEFLNLASKGISLAEKISKNGQKVDEYIELSKKLEIIPDELIDFLITSDLPIRTGIGKKFVESIVGFKGLGIETIDHHLTEFNYENISDYSEEKLEEEVSITTIMYRVPPYMLTIPDRLAEVDKKISDIVGSRFIWLIRPKGLKEDQWVGATGSKDPIVRGEAQFINGILIPSTITLIDIINKCIIIETPWLNLKLGSEKISEKIRNLTDKKVIVSELIQLKDKEANIYRTIQKWGLRFDYVYFCYWGRGLSTDPFDVECPFKNCEVRRKGLCDGKRLWSGKYGYRKPYPKVYPLRDSQFQNDGIKIYSESLPARIVNFSAYDSRHVQNYWYGVEFGTWFIRNRPIIRIFFGDEDRYLRIGYTIQTSVMELSFDDNWLEEAILDSLSKDGDLRNSLAMKYIFSKSMSRLEYEKLAEIIEDLLSKGESYETYKKIKNMEFKRDFITFCKQVFVHSFEHIFTQFILKNLLGIEPNFIISKYYYNAGKYPNNVNKVLIAENAKNGRIGIVETVVKKIKEIGLAQFLMEFCNFALDYLKIHTEEVNKIDENRMREAQKSLEIARTKINDSDKLQKLERIKEVMKTLKEKLDKVGLELDSTLARLYILIKGELDDKILVDLEDYFDDILDYYGFRICVDGCNACIRLERECGEGIGQIITTSKLLLLRVLEFLKHKLEHGINQSGKNVGKLIEPLLASARNKVWISTPYISDYYVKDLIRNLADKGVEIKILTSPIAETEENKYHQKALEELNKLTKNFKNVKVKILENLHAKIYIIDEKYVITGSANLTLKGMKYNIENVIIKMDKKSIKEFKKHFEEKWNKGVELHKLKLKLNYKK